MLKHIFLLTLAVNLWSSDIEKGKNLFNGYCAICHSTTGKHSMGPDLNLTSYTKTKEEIANYITNPSKYFEQWGYSANAMPELPLKKEEVDLIVDYVDKLQPFKKWMKKN